MTRAAPLGDRYRRERHRTRFRLMMASSSHGHRPDHRQHAGEWWRQRTGLAASCRRWRRWAGTNRPRPPRRPPRRSDAGGADRVEGGRARRSRRSSDPGEHAERPFRAPAKTPKTKTPKAGRVKHVFVITLYSPGYDNAFGAQSEMPYLANTLRPQGRAALELLAADRRGAAELHRDGRRAAAQRADLGRLHDLRGVPTERAAGRQRERRRQRVRLSGAGDQRRRPALQRPVHLGRLHGGHGEAGAGRSGTDRAGESTADLRASGLRRGRPDHTTSARPDPATDYAGTGYAARHNPFVYFHSLLDLGSCTQRDVPLDRLDGALQSGHTQLHVHLAEPLRRGRADPVRRPASSDPGPAQADEFLRTWVPKILASPAYQRTAS